MNLGKLLGAGKSFLGGRGAVSYRADKHVYLPKFNSGNNPFSTKAAEPVPAAGSPAPKKISAPSVAPVAVKPQKISAPPPPPSSPPSGRLLIYSMGASAAFSLSTNVLI